MSTPARSAFSGPDVPAPALIDACVHCGFCLPACPTYAIAGEEMNSPRGRVYLMKAAHDGRTAITDKFVEHFDNCLGCLGCLTACPSGVQYGALLEATRSQIETHHRRPLADRLFRRAAFALFPFRRRLRIALLPLVAYRRIAPLVAALGLNAVLPRRVVAMLDTAPPVSLRSLFSRTPEDTAAASPRRLKVGLLTGCAQQLMFPAVNDATVRVLTAEGCDVTAPARQGCCGALSLHAGRLEDARNSARDTIVTFEQTGVDTIVTNAAGCGSAMKEYGHLLKDDAAWAARAARFSARVRDVNEQLVELGPAQAGRSAMPLRVVYQDACHLAHAQGIRQAPRELLKSIPGLTLVEPQESELCCGSAGIYNLLEPETARILGDRKVDALTAEASDVIVTANPGCRLQILAAGRRAGRSLDVRHPIELLDRSIRGSQGAGASGHSPR
jgi:glycolate oxidase iron-sulfur subunit